MPETVPDIILDALNRAQMRRDSILSVAKTSVSERISFHRDVTGLSALLVGGIITLFGVDTNRHLIKTSWLLYVAGTTLTINIVLGLVARNVLLIHLQSMVVTVETAFSNIADTVKQLRIISTESQDAPQKTERQAVAVNDLVKAEGPITLPALSKLGEHSQKWVTVILVSALICIVLALIVRVSG